MTQPIIARQFWIQAPGRAAIVAAELPPRGPGEALVRTRYSGVSRGTEALVFRGEVPASQRLTMRAPFQQGEFPGPVTSGYASVGVVLEVDDDARDLADHAVFCLHPHQDLYCVPVNALIAVPDSVRLERAILAANMETAINIVWDAAPSVGDRIIVIGAGVVGLLVAWLCRQMAGTRVTIVDVDPAKRAAAETLGVDFRSAPPPPPPADVVIHASGQPDGLRAALAVAADDAVVVEASWYGTRSVTLPLGEEFHPRRLTIRSSQVGRVPPHRTPRWTRRRRLTLALDLLSSSSLDVLIDAESPFEELPNVLARLSRAPGALCHRVRY